MQPIEDRTAKITAEEQFDILDATTPTATMMMRVATADGNVSNAEVEAVALLVATTVDRMGLPHDAEVERNLVALLVDVDPSDQNVARAASSIVADATARAEIGRWVREVTYADGGGTPAEARTILALASAMRNAGGR